MDVDGRANNPSHHKKVIYCEVLQKASDLGGALGKTQEIKIVREIVNLEY
jgi:hypothetical protein